MRRRRQIRKQESSGCSAICKFMTRSEVCEGYNDLRVVSQNRLKVAETLRKLNVRQTKKKKQRKKLLFSLGVGNVILN
jgi:hypothetical protein